MSAIIAPSKALSHHRRTFCFKKSAVLFKINASIKKFMQKDNSMIISNFAPCLYYNLSATTKRKRKLFSFALPRRILSTKKRSFERFFISYFCEVFQSKVECLSFHLNSSLHLEFEAELVELALAVVCPLVFVLAYNQRFAFVLGHE